MSNYIDSNMASFGTDVIEASKSQLVLVDFWADWCQPCRSLAPILEGLVEKYQGAIRLVKVNTDENQELAGHLGIRSLPTVFFFHNGQVVDQFVGVQPESGIREIIDRHTDGQSSIEEQIAAAAQAYEAGQTEQAREFVSRLIHDNPDNDQPKCLLLGWLCREGNDVDAKTIAESISEESRESPEYRAYLVRLELQEQARGLPTMDELLKVLEANADDLQARFELSQHFVMQQKYEEAMKQLLEIIRQDRNFNDGEARKTMIRVFELLGGRGPLVTKYRGQLARTLN